MSNMNFNCDVCGREVYGCTFVNGMDFCAKCYQETFGETDKDRQIADLQSQLAEKDKEIEELHTQIEQMAKDYTSEIAFYTGTENQKALEQLEKVKDIILNERKITSFNFDTFNKGKDTALFWLNEQINQQINELKGKVEDVKD